MYLNISKDRLKELWCVFRCSRQDEEEEAEDEHERTLPWMAYFRNMHANNDGLVLVRMNQKHVGKYSVTRASDIGDGCCANDGQKS